MGDGKTTPTRFYKYLKWDTGARRIISDGTVKFTHPSDFNDPFDCQPIYSDVSVESLNQGRPGYLREIAKNMGMTASDYLQEKNKMVQRLQKSVESGEYHRKMLQFTGVLSLTECPTDILMWSHYADQHKGFVVEFRVELEGEFAPSIDNLEDIIPLQVTYDNKRPVVDLAVDPRKYKEENIKVLLTKSPHWSYEKEWRFIDYIRGSGIHPFSVKKHLVGVIAGARMNDYQVESLRSTVETAENTFGISLELHKAELKKDVFEVWIPGHHSSM